MEENTAVIVRDKNGRFAPGTKTHAPITKENAHIYRRRREEKAAAALRARILESTRKRSTLPLNTSADAVAEAGAYIWDEVVLGQDVYPRDRLEAWEKLSKYAQVLPSDLKRQDDNTSTAQAAALGAAAGAAAALKAVLDDVLASDNINYRKHDVIEATAADSDTQTDRKQ